MATISIYEKMGTRYIINSMYQKFDGILEEAMKNGDTVDLVDCKLGPSSASVIGRYYGKLNIINSGRKEWNDILIRNTQAALTEEEEYPTFRIPINPTMEDFAELSATLKTGDSYRLMPSLDSNKQTAFAVLLILKNPGINWDIYERGVKIYEFIYNEWKMREQPHNSYIEFFAGTVRTLTCDSRGKIGTPAGGYLTPDLYCLSHKILPEDFGTKQLININSKGNPEGEWAEVVLKCIKTLMPSRQKEVKLTDYLTFRKG